MGDEGARGSPVVTSVPSAAGAGVGEALETGRPGLRGHPRTCHSIWL